MTKPVLEKPALFVGRFQPFHNGHLDIINCILKKHQKLIIVIGSAEKAFEKENPLKASERKKIIEAALKEAAVRRAQFEIIPLKDLNDFPNWAPYILKNTPKIDTVYTGSKLVKDCFSGKYSKTCKTYTPLIKIKWIKKRIKVSGTEVREKIAKNKNWEKSVPKSTAKLLKKFKIAQRLK